MMKICSSWKALAFLTAAPVAILAIYVVSVIWRVSLAQQEIFGRSELIKFGYGREFNEPAQSPYWGQPTYTIQYGDKQIVVFRQKINGFQHMYGSALADFELGPRLSRDLFAANEWAEYCFDFNGVSTEDLMDRRKDLANNKLGRKIGELARQKGLHGAAAEAFIVDTSVKCMDHPEFLPYYVDMRWLALGDEASLGCPYLPKRNIFNWLSKPFRGVFQKPHKV
ncbi:MAG: hypothetical protein QG625_4143 [Cyanobacteriota bacterium erpe_2018_sw_39hr_WHONDRS-SW48-000098_B_bin.30]|jgi:hypothetical protein|nr:hypothetical protein [Candidatus Obscuribacter sp.]MDQ5967986.1 hypothetical protein [Cyanobacteriota bacterium erpe_2018_sw_39hr_WHONDRS-SW48-000098_B_bin.30]